MVKLTTALFVFFLLTAFPVRAQDFVGLELKTVNGTAIPLVDGQFEKTVPTKIGGLGVFTWFLSNDVAHGDTRWSEIYAGPTWYPRKWLEIAIGAGVESDAHPWRIGCEVIAAGKYGVMIFACEQGGSGPWYRFSYAHHVAGRLSAGFFSRRYSGTGPFFELKLTNRYSVWFTAGPDLETHRFKSVTGLNIGLP